MNFKLITLLAFGFLLFGCLNNTPNDNRNASSVNQSSDASAKPIAPVDLNPDLEITPVTNMDLDNEFGIARLFALNSPTYKWDGSNLTFVKTFEEGAAKIFEFNFTSSHGGYGNRTGQFVTLSFTSHVIKIQVENGKVTKATIDDKWDEIKQEEIQETTKK